MVLRIMEQSGSDIQDDGTDRLRFLVGPRMMELSR